MHTIMSRLYLSLTSVEDFSAVTFPNKKLVRVLSLILVREKVYEYETFP